MKIGVLILLRSKIKRKLLRREKIRRFFRTFVSVPRGKSYLFVVGCYNSGTTLLADMLTQHPEISPLPTEGSALTDALPRPEDLVSRRN